MWKDTSSYSQGAKDKTPHCFEVRAAGLKVVVHRHIHYPPDVWLASAEPFFHHKELESKDIDGAKEETATLIKNCLADVAKVFGA